MRKALNIVMLALALVPLVLTAVAVAFLLPPVVPMHVGFDGAVRWGSRAEDIGLGAILTFANLICAFCGIFAERLAGMGLLNGTDNPQVARYVLLGTIVVIDVVCSAVLAWQLWR